MDTVLRLWLEASPRTRAELVDAAAYLRHAYRHKRRDPLEAALWGYLGRVDDLHVGVAIGVCAWMEKMRDEHGGQRVYTRKTESPNSKATRLGALLRAKVPLLEAFQQVGVSRATGYRLLKRLG